MSSQPGGPQAFSPPPGEPVYTRGLVMHVRLFGGGYLYGYDIRRDGQLVGALTITRQTRRSDEVRVWTHEGTDYGTRTEFIAAVEATVPPVPQPEPPRPYNRCGE